MIDITQWLEQLGLGKYAAIFIEMEVDMEILPELTEADLEKLGIPLGSRKKILKAIARQDSASSGSPIAAPKSVSSAERRHLSVMFCDLVGSTALSEKFDPEDLGQVIREFQNCCQNVIKKYDGYIARYMGDGILVYFGYPKAHEDDVERAIHAGLEIIESVSQVRPFDLSLQTRIGIATGLVVIGEEIGEGYSRERSVVGETPNLAARLQSIATPDAVVIGDNSWRLAGGIFECINLGKHELKGFSEPVQAWQPVAEKSIDSRYEATRGSTGITPIVGRQEEVEILQRRWKMVTEGKGQVAMLSGEAGIGKSRLIQALRDHIGDQPHSLLRLYCTPYHQNSALYPLIKHMERAAHFERSDDSESRLNKLETLLQTSNENYLEVANILASLLSIPTDGRYPPMDFSAPILKEKTMATLEARFNILARKQPVLAIFEDLHWVDPSTLELLERAISLITDARVFFVFTARPEFVAPWSSVPLNITLMLNRLDHLQIKQLIGKVTGGKTLPSQLVESITEKTDGIPLFVEELTKTVLEANFLEDAGDHYVLNGPIPALAVPNTLKDSLMARLDRSPSAKEVAQTAAVIGRAFSYEMLFAVSDLVEFALQNTLLEIQQTDLVFRRGQPPESQYTFKHALVQDAAYDSLLRSKCQIVHSKIGLLLEQRFPEIVDSEPELLANHFTLACDYKQAIKYWQKAGQRALSRSAYLESVSHCKKGLELLAGQAKTRERGELELEFRSLLGVGSVATMGYAADEIAENYARSQEVCQELGETPRLIPTLYGLWVYHLLRGHREDAENLAEQLYQRASDSKQPLVTCSAKAITTFYSGDRNHANDYLTEAMGRFNPGEHDSMASTFGDDADLLPHFYHYWNLWLCGYPDQAIACLRSTQKQVEKIGTPYLVATSMLFEMILWHELRDINAVADAATRFKTHSSEQGFPFFVALGVAGSGWTLVQQNQAEQGIADIQLGIANFRLTGARLPVSYWLHYLVEANLECGNVEPGLEAVNEALELTNTQLDDFYQPELYRLKGELLRQNMSDIQLVKDCFNSAIDLAKAQNSKILELRATMSMSRLLAEKEKEKARSMLAELYNWFSEGFETVDLQEARKLLTELS